MILTPILRCSAVWPRRPEGKRSFRRSCLKPWRFVSVSPAIYGINTPSDIHPPPISGMGVTTKFVSQRAPRPMGNYPCGPARVTAPKPHCRPGGRLSDESRYAAGNRWPAGALVPGRIVYRWGRNAGLLRMGAGRYLDLSDTSQPRV